MSAFAFVGKLSASKSILNRLLVTQSYNEELQIVGESEADDVRVMRAALDQLAKGQDIPVGHAGTVLRFMAFRASRVPGRHRLVGHPRLFERPQEELVQVLAQLGVEARLGRDALEIEGDGWQRLGDTLMVPFGRSSQFGSGVLLNSWGLPFDLYVSPTGSMVSEGYWRMTLRLAERCGLELDHWDRDFRVRRGQRPRAGEVTAEIDASSAFAVAAIAAVSGSTRLLNFPPAGLQPDVAFVDILAKMGVPIAREESALKVERAKTLTGVAVNLKSTPDLFPVLAVLAALARGESDLYGAPHLVHKESDRQAKIVGLVRELGREAETYADGVRFRGEPLAAPGPGVRFDCEHDHRLAFAAAVLRAAGFDIEIVHPEAVTKSFPEFWSLLGWPIA